MVRKKHVNDPPCDKEPVSISVGDRDEEQFEEEHVHRVYEDISVHFSHTRYGPWKNVVRLINEAPANSFILDVGCGNGKYLNARSDCFFLGVDVCSALLRICSEKGNICSEKSNISNEKGKISSEKNKTDLLLSNNLRLGVRDNAADLTLSIAVIHHVSTAKRRLDAIWELIRCTRPRGKIVIYVWSFEQDRSYIGYREFKSQDVLVPWNLQPVYASATGSVGGNTVTGDTGDATAAGSAGSATATGGGIANSSIGNARIGSTSIANTLIGSTGTGNTSIGNTKIDSALIDSKTIGSTRTDNNTKTDNNTTINNTKTDNNTKSLESYGRYYHVFTREEVDGICWHFREHVEWAVGSDCNNWVIEMIKR